MSKKILIIIVSVALGILLVSLVSYYFIIQNNGGEPGGIVTVFRNFFPFGGGNTPIGGVATTTEPTPTTPPAVTNFTKKLRRLSLEQVSGAGVFDVKAGTIVRHIERATGHIFETELFSPNQNRISNTTIPVVYDAIWGNKGASLITRYLKEDDQTIDTYSLTIKEVSTTTENTITGIVFPLNLSEVSVLGNSVFYLQSNDTSSIGYTSNFDGKNKKQIWNSPIKELLSQYINTKTIALTTKPAQDIGGYLYFIDTGSGQVRKILGNISGLSTLVNDLGTQVLYLNESSTAQMFFFDIKSKSNTTLSPVTFPEKCVWSKKDRNIIYCAVPKESIDGSSLTLWYKGLNYFTDDIWKYDIKNNSSSLVEDLSNDSGELIDVMKPILSDNEQYIVFMNRIDNTLWSLDLTK